MGHVAARTIPVPTTTTDVALIGGASLLSFYGFTETTGSATAEVALYDGSDANGALIVSITLDQGQSTRDPIPAPLLEVQTGLFLEVVSGSVKGSVWVVPLERLAPYAETQGDPTFWSGRS